MPSLAFFAATAASLLSVAAAQSTTAAPAAAAPAESFPATPLASKHFAYPSGIPYQADPDDGVRGRQSGYNLCNSTTEGQTSLCQTSFLNHLDDFCLWAPATPDSLIADTEGEEVAWCTKPGRGTRLIPPGALTGVQFMRTPDYVQVVGFIDQTKINIKDGDSGGELDPHGADLRGNPLGSLVYSNAFPSNNGNNDTFQQVIEWHNFMGGNQFCFKVCDPAGANAANFCQHIYDRIGCAYNAPNAAQNGTFEACEGENQDFPGVYTSNGAVVTYTQPAESLGAITTMPYTARLPASSNCVPFQSADLYAAVASVFPTTSSTSSGASATGTNSSGAKSSGASGSKTASGAGASNTANAGSSMMLGRTKGQQGALGAVLGVMAGVSGVVFSIAFLA
ncbi:hypothetical protein SCHPADRAFT_734147 [Schizopora paradoxa]|uniref:Macrofage activating glyco protein n=1 Tax=Schizopora paradoxa TaxID=27342 RepID=A0A0H2RK62_9AGAM|nr:hypothetical protein SCHPADRAFT_734147 [Schizopora paradoxa]